MKVLSAPLLILLAMLAIISSPVLGEADTPPGDGNASDPYAPPGGPMGSPLKLMDAWLSDQNLNIYGDPMDTVYIGGNPLFNMETGELMDRYQYVLQKFPSEPWLSSSVKLIRVDKWLESQGLNMYGDPLGTAYVGGSPLFDESTGETKDRYEYLLEKFPHEPWQEEVFLEVTFAMVDDPDQYEPPGGSMDSPLKLMDAWLASREDLNMYGDPVDTVYAGGSPLYNEETGETIDRYQYVLERFPDEPWLSTSAKLIRVDKWLKSQGLNMFGDVLGTTYVGGSPLFDESTGETADRYEYLLEKFPDEPWQDEVFLARTFDMQSVVDTDDGTNERNTNDDMTNGGMVGRVSLSSLILSLLLVAIVH